ncbi:MAG TPA: transcription factor [Methanocorpusculum sp.]|nr:transcription factor [Methanocorpusculum sp.]
MTVIKKKDLKKSAIYQYLEKLVGEEGMEFIQKCPDGEYSDEDIAEITGINLNTVRHSLYNLYEKRLADYRRIKNNETGWLTYLWTMKMENISNVLTAEMASVKEKLAARLAFDQKNDFYQCSACGQMMTFTDAMSLDFKCPECGENMTHFDDELLLSALEKRIAAITAALENR